MTQVLDPPSSETIVVIRPKLKKLCADNPCRAALFNHLLYWIARKQKHGEDYWYATGEELYHQLAESWGITIVRRECNFLIESNFVGETNNPKWGADRTKYFYFHKEQAKALFTACSKQNICPLCIGLPSDVLSTLILPHLINLLNANDTFVKCICQNHQMSVIGLSNATDKSVTAITKDSTKDSYQERDDSPIGEAKETPSSPTPVPSFSANADWGESLSSENQAAEPEPPTQETSSYSHNRLSPAQQLEQPSYIPEHANAMEEVQEEQGSIAALSIGNQEEWRSDPTEEMPVVRGEPIKPLPGSPASRLPSRPERNAGQLTQAPGHSTKPDTRPSTAGRTTRPTTNTGSTDHTSRSISQEPSRAPTQETHEESVYKTKIPPISEQFVLSLKLTNYRAKRLRELGLNEEEMMRYTHLETGVFTRCGPPVDEKGLYAEVNSLVHLLQTFSDSQITAMTTLWLSGEDPRYAGDLKATYLTATALWSKREQAIIALKKKHKWSDTASPGESSAEPEQQEKPNIYTIDWLRERDRAKTEKAIAAIQAQMDAEEAALAATGGAR